MLFLALSIAIKFMPAQNASVAINVASDPTVTTHEGAVIASKPTAVIPAAGSAQGPIGAKTLKQAVLLDC